MYSDKDKQHNENASGIRVNYLEKGIKFLGRPVVDCLYQTVLFPFACFFVCLKLK